MLPIFEVRGGIPFALTLGVNPIQAFAICVIANIIVIPILFLFLDFIHILLLKWNFYNRTFEKFLNRIQKRKENVEKNYETYGILALCIFVAIPFPLTGAWTGVLIAWLLKLKRWRSFFAISLGIIISATIVELLTLGIISLF